MKWCPNCGKALTKDGICSNCGSSSVMPGIKMDVSDTKDSNQPVNKDTPEINDNNICKKCGKKIIKSGKFCNYCGAELEKEKSDVGGIILIILGLLLIIIPSFTIDYSGRNIVYVSWIVGLLLIIMGKINYPKSTVVSILFWISIALIAVDVVALITVLSACRIL